MTRKSVKPNQRRDAQQTFSHPKSSSNQRPHIFLPDLNAQEVKRALSPFWAWRLER